jgi:disulfide bond formation protein DsbB
MNIVMKKLLWIALACSLSVDIAQATAPGMRDLFNHVRSNSNAAITVATTVAIAAFAYKIAPNRIVKALQVGLGTVGTLAGVAHSWYNTRHSDYIPGLFEKCNAKARDLAEPIRVVSTGPKNPATTARLQALRDEQKAMSALASYQLLELGRQNANNKKSMPYLYAYLGSTAAMTLLMLAAFTTKTSAALAATPRTLVRA